MTGKSLKSILKKILINPFDIPFFVYLILAVLSCIIFTKIGAEVIGQWVFSFFFFMMYIVGLAEGEKEEREKERRENDGWPSSYRGGAAWLEDLISIILGIVFFIGGIAFLVFLVKFFWNSF